MNAIGPGILTIAGLAFGLALVAVVVSKNAQTPQVAQGVGTALSQIIGAAVQPVTGSNSFGSVGQSTAGTSG